ncbi:MAG: putative transcription factor [Candidatus Nanohaloarchaea archaeon]|jgi:putative transcription factor
MPSCELCGKTSDSLTKVKIEGAKLNVCDSCSDMGEKIKTPKKNKKKKKSKSRNSTKRRKEKVLAQDYGKKVKKAREEEQLSIKEVADDLNEKESLIKKVESAKLKPDKALAQKIGHKFDIDLYVTPAVNDVDTDSGDTRKAKVGDVADIKE